MPWLIDRLRPSGTTSRLAYWQAMVAIAVMSLALGLLDQTGRSWVWAPIIIIAAPITLAKWLLTIRRLRDAGWSPWQVLWFLFPFEISWELYHVTLLGQSFQLINVTAFLQMLPVLIGLFAASRTPVEPPLIMLPAS